jgi:hypothetical protein
LRDADRDYPGNPEEHKVHCQKGWQTRYRHGSFNEKPYEIGNEIPRNYQGDIDDEQGHGSLPKLAIFQHFWIASAMAAAEFK